MSKHLTNSFLERLRQLQLNPRLPYHGKIEEVLTGETSENRSGYPIISEESFLTILDEIPHLFHNGLNLIQVSNAYLKILPNLIGFSPTEKASLERALKVLQNVAFTAGVTAPSDLWILKYTISNLNTLGVFSQMGHDWTSIKAIADSLKLDFLQFKTSLSFLNSRGFIELDYANENVRFCLLPHAYEALKAPQPFDKAHQINWVPKIMDTLIKPNSSTSLHVSNFFKISNKPSPKRDWVPDSFEIEVGHRLVPIVLALRALEITDHLKSGQLIFSTLSNLNAEILSVLFMASLIDTNGIVTELGERVFSRGPGPMGIIHAYHSYLTQQDQLLLGNESNIWVARGENVAASQDANRKSFKKIILSLNQFLSSYEIKLDLFIEHAVGQGEATRLQWTLGEQQEIQYIGADLEDAAINAAISQQKAGKLPENMQFIKNADIGSPESLLEPLSRMGIKTENSVMVVGNGFHEVRNQSNEKMAQVFQKYSDANIILVFTEESGLSDDDLLNSGWNTYHAGFRYVHQISGQGLRPALDNPLGYDETYSWKKCAELGGYFVSPNYSSHSRTIYPHKRKDGGNPSISVNYFCIPRKLALKLKLID